MELKAPHPIKYYKTRDNWYKAIYRANKSEIDKATEGINAKTARWRIIKDDIESRAKRENITRPKALKALSNTEKYTSPAERSIKNVRSALSNSKKTIQKLQNLTRDKQGKFAKIDYTKMQYLGNRTYLYKNPNGDDIVISFENSPEEIKIVTYEQYINE